MKFKTIDEKPTFLSSASISNVDLFDEKNLLLIFYLDIIIWVFSLMFLFLFVIYKTKI